MRFAKLRGRIIEKFGSQAAFAGAMGWREALLSAKLNSKSDWSFEDVMKACELLEIPVGNAHTFFSAENYESVTK